MFKPLEKVKFKDDVFYFTGIIKNCYVFATSRRRARAGSEDLIIGYLALERALKEGIR